MKNPRFEIKKQEESYRATPFLAAVLVALLMAGAACGGGGADNGDDNNGAFCSTSQPCPGGQYCWNGLCLPGCLTNKDCAADQYCSIDGVGSGVCVNKEVPSCTNDDQCDDGEVCKNGMCSKVTPKNCTPRADGMDGCDAFSICFDEDDEGPKAAACYAFPPCGENGACPVGQLGAMCNDGDIPQKARICLTSLCKSAAHCPQGFRCIVLSGTIGMCSSGSIASPCKSKEDCAAGLNCQGALPGFPGICAP